METCLFRHSALSENTKRPGMVGLGASVTTVKMRVNMNGWE